MSRLPDARKDADIEPDDVAHTDEPRAGSACYDPTSGRVRVDLKNGCLFAFTHHLVEELATATPEQLAAVEIVGNGYGLYWEALDADVALPSLMSGVFGTQAWMARRAGQATSPAKAAAARANGALGGRPRKSTVV